MNSETDARGERGVRQLSAILPNGRTLWLRVAEPLAPAASLDHLAHLVERAGDGRRAAIAAHVDAIDRLSARVSDDTERLQRGWAARQRESRRRLLAGSRRLEQRFERAWEELQSRLDRQLKIDDEHLRRLRRRDFWDKILLASSLPFFAAYGDREDPFGSNNLALLFLLLIWLAGDEVVQAIFGTGSSKSRYAVADADVWSYIAPIANGLAAWWLLGDRQHERFVTGVTTVPLDGEPVRPGHVFHRYHVEVDLRTRIATDHFPDFETFSDVPAVATLGAMHPSNGGAVIDPRISRLTAKVRQGVLKLTFEAVPQKACIDIGWMVDTDDPSRHVKK